VSQRIALPVAHREGLMMFNRHQCVVLAEVAENMLVRV
jgi:hypothetical protein